MEFIYSNRHLLNTYNMLATVFGTEDTAVNTTFLSQ